MSSWGRALVLGVCLAALATPSMLNAHFNSGLYSHKNSDCASRTDPITVVFYGDAWANRALNHVKFHTGWGGGDGGGQYFASHGICSAGDKHAESGTFTRYHIRMGRTEDNDPDWGATTTATPHHEDWSNECNFPIGGHAVDKGGVDKGDGLQSGFDQGRLRIYQSFTATHHTFAGSVYWGNTQEFKQCDDDWAGSHGHVHWWRIPDWTH
jgi:hypothetical protein